MKQIKTLVFFLFSFAIMHSVPDKMGCTNSLGQDGAKIGQDVAKIRQDGAKMGQDGTKMGEDGAKMAPR